jgi:hypothetical protein
MFESRQREPPSVVVVLVSMIKILMIMMMLRIMMMMMAAAVCLLCRDSIAATAILYSLSSGENAVVAALMSKDVVDIP